MEQRFLSTLEKLLAIPAPPGFESRMAAFVVGELQTMGYAPSVDLAGNVILPLEGSEPTLPHVMYAAHLDEIAVVVRTIHPDGSLTVTRSGGMLPLKTGERPLLFLGDTEDVVGVVSFGTGHTASGGNVRDWSDVTILTGLTPAELKAAGVRPGTPGVPHGSQRGPVLLGSGNKRLVGTWTLDDRGGMAVLIEWLRTLKETGARTLHPTTVVFTVHEEGGCHGAATLTARLRPDLFIAVDGAPWAAGNGFDVDDRPVAWSKDQRANYHQGLLACMRQAACQAGTELQHAVLETGYSDASSVYQNGAVPRVGIIGHARYNSHGFEVARLGVFPNIIKTLTRLAGMRLV